MGRKKRKDSCPITQEVRRPSPREEDDAVRRLRFSATGELVDESTFATEAELAGFRPEQAVLPIGAGERPGSGGAKSRAAWPGHSGSRLRRRRTCPSGPV